MMDGDAPAKCSRQNKDGSACNAQPWRDGICRWHHPDSAQQLAEGRRKGGRARSTANRAKRHLPAGCLTVDELRGVVGITIAKVLGGSVEPGVGNAVASLARAYVAVTEAGAVEEIGRRLDELETVANRRGAS